MCFTLRSVSTFSRAWQCFSKLSFGSTDSAQCPPNNGSLLCNYTAD